MFLHKARDSKLKAKKNDTENILVNNINKYRNDFIRANDR